MGTDQFLEIHIFHRYYACLCGHFELVKYLLLTAGAKCNVKTFQGERCFYGALTSEIREFLVSEAVMSAACLYRSDYGQFTER